MTRDGTFLVEGGKIVGPVRNLRFTQSYLDALARVTAVGRERRTLRGFLGGVGRPGPPHRRLDLHRRHGALTGRIAAAARPTEPHRPRAPHAHSITRRAEHRCSEPRRSADWLTSRASCRMDDRCLARRRELPAVGLCASLAGDSAASNAMIGARRRAWPRLAATCAIDAAWQARDDPARAWRARSGRRGYVARRQPATRLVRRSTCPTRSSDASNAPSSRDVTVEQAARACCGRRAATRGPGLPGRRPRPRRGQLRSCDRFRARLPPGTPWQTEVPLPISGDRTGVGCRRRHRNGRRIGIEAETRLRDIQAVAPEDRPEAARRRRRRRRSCSSRDTVANRRDPRSDTATSLATSVPARWARDPLARCAPERAPSDSGIVVL